MKSFLHRVSYLSLLSVSGVLFEELRWTFWFLLLLPLSQLGYLKRGHRCEEGSEDKEFAS